MTDDSSGETTSRRRRTRDEQQAETRQRLLDAAAELAAERGFDGASIDRITERAGYTRGAFYSNFDSKEALFIEVCEQRFRAYADELVPLVLAVPAEHQLREAARLIKTLKGRPEALLLIELARMRGDDPSVGKLIEDFLDRFTDLVDDVLAGQPQLSSLSPAERRRGARGMIGAVLALNFLAHIGLDDEDTGHLIFDGVALAAFGDNLAALDSLATPTPQDLS